MAERFGCRAVCVDPVAANLERGADLEHVDPECAPLDYVMGESRQAKLRRVMCNKFAFGGINTSLVFAEV